MGKIAINGMGRIGRAALKIILDSTKLELVAVNDLMPLDNLVYLLKYDSVYGRYHRKVEMKDGNLVVDGKTIKFLSVKDPAQLPWKDLDVDVVCECTGVFTNLEGMQKHLKAGAKFALLSAPPKGADVCCIVHGVTQAPKGEKAYSCASCTTNCISPVIEVIGRHFGIKKAIMTTIHAYTSSQAIVDGPAKKWARGRAGAANFVPTSTGAAKAVTDILPHVQGQVRRRGGAGAGALRFHGRHRHGPGKAHHRGGGQQHLPEGSRSPPSIKAYWARPRTPWSPRISFRTPGPRWWSSA